MAEIIDMNNRRSLSQKTRDAIRKKRNILAVQDDWIDYRGALDRFTRSKELV
jgi:hypothetical protein